jgi:prephenate dehydrogenase
MKVAVLGAGKMGVWFAKFFLAEGYSVVVADRKKEKLVKLKNEMPVETADFADAAKHADWVLICVSINAIETVAEKIGPVITEKQVVMDIASLKTGPVKTMHEYITKGVVLGTHPVFGPGSKNLSHKTFILTPTSNEEEEFASKFKEWLRERNARVFITTPKKHDELMSVVLGFPHFIGVAACETLLEQEDFPETKKVAGTTYRMLFTLAEATALENPELFAALQVSLPKVEQVEKSFMKNAQEWLDIIKSKDEAALVERMEKMKAKLMKTGVDYTRSYEIMYKMLEAAES